MSDSWTLDQVDTDGAIREAAEKVDGQTRSAFLRKAGIAGGAVLGSSAVLFRRSRVLVSQRAMSRSSTSR